jgi:hypothetical protein
MTTEPDKPSDPCAELEDWLGQLHPDWKIVPTPLGVQAVDADGKVRLGPGTCRGVLDKLRPEITLRLFLGKRDDPPPGQAGA